MAFRMRPHMPAMPDFCLGKSQVSDFRSHFGIRQSQMPTKKQPTSNLWLRKSEMEWIKSRGMMEFECVAAAQVIAAFSDRQPLRESLHAELAEYHRHIELERRLLQEATLATRRKKRELERLLSSAFLVVGGKRGTEPLERGRDNSGGVTKTSAMMKSLVGRLEVFRRAVAALGGSSRRGKIIATGSGMRNSKVKWHHLVAMADSRRSEIVGNLSRRYAKQKDKARGAWHKLSGALLCSDSST